MTSQVRVDLGSSVAADDQVRLQLLALVATHRLAPGCAAPSVHDVAVSAGLSTSVVEGAYRTLHELGLLVPGGAGTHLVAPDAAPLAAAELRTAVVGLAAAARAAGLDDEQVLDLVHGAVLGPAEPVLPSQRTTSSHVALTRSEPLGH